jgi:hypothetical protein
MPGSPSCGRAHDPSAAKKKLTEAGYGGEPIVVIAPTELAGIRALSLIGAGQLRHAKTPNARDALASRNNSRRRCAAAGNPSASRSGGFSLACWRRF